SGAGPGVEVVGLVGDELVVALPRDGGVRRGADQHPIVLPHMVDRDRGEPRAPVPDQATDRDRGEQPGGGGAVEVDEVATGGGHRLLLSRRRSHPDARVTRRPGTNVLW